MATAARGGWAAWSRGRIPRGGQGLGECPRARCSYQVCVCLGGGGCSFHGDGLGTPDRGGGLVRSM